ncbi:hypothetical protein AALO_G00001680 [Alosa alosa]|uniref:Uncharacterized protein n=1 Tax=Alosa alosa TaxID=278164 RepID=A0AAV6HIJ5_9TELE|nr:hypothetical protein AALO_G00001680 [Alosa alosa]
MVRCQTIHFNDIGWPARLVVYSIPKKIHIHIFNPVAISTAIGCVECTVLSYNADAVDPEFVLIWKRAQGGSFPDGLAEHIHICLHIAHHSQLKLSVNKEVIFGFMP